MTPFCSQGKPLLEKTPLRKKLRSEIDEKIATGRKMPISSGPHSPLPSRTTPTTRHHNPPPSPPSTPSPQLFPFTTRCLRPLWRRPSFSLCQANATSQVTMAASRWRRKATKEGLIRLATPATVAPSYRRALSMGRPPSPIKK